MNSVQFKLLHYIFIVHYIFQACLQGLEIIRDMWQI